MREGAMYAMNGLKYGKPLHRVGEFAKSCLPISHRRIKHLTIQPQGGRQTVLLQYLRQLLETLHRTLERGSVTSGLLRENSVRAQYVLAVRAILEGMSRGTGNNKG